MIGCTEFIPAYSELFKYIEEKSGYEGVTRFWDYLFAPDGEGISLINHLEKHGIKGCFTYWSISLNEEAADFSMYLNEPAGWFMLKMNKCPSKGRLIKLSKERGFSPYPHYCLHCDYYRSAAEKAGFEYIFNTEGTEHASCSIIIYDPKIFDGRIIIDENTLVMNRSDSDNEYFHPEFHTSMNMGIDYVGENFGTEGVKEYLRKYTLNVYGNLISDIEANGIDVLESELYKAYEKEKATDVIQTICDKNTLKVKVKYCPGVNFLTKSGKKVSSWYRYTKETVMEAIAEKSGLNFTLLFYDEVTGASEYEFTRPSN